MVERFCEITKLTALIRLKTALRRQWQCLKIVFKKLLLRWNARFFVEAAVIEPIITLTFIVELLYIIKVWKFLFPWTLVSCFAKLLQTWISRFLWKQPSMSLSLCWCLLHEDVNRIRKVLFIWMVIVSVNFSVFAEPTCHLWAFNHLDAYYVLTSWE